MEVTQQARGLTPQAFRMRVLLIVSLGIAVIGVVLSLHPIPQDPTYHNFADQRSMLAVPHLLNVVSNAPLVLVGALGLTFLRVRGAHGRGPFTDPSERWAFLVLFAGVGLTGFGSGYYHLAPSNATLVWDRLPMTIAFMSLFASIVAERISLSAGRLLLLPLLAVGIVSVMTWHVGGVRGAGDLRLYGFVQYCVLLSIPLLVLLFPPRYTRTADLFGALGWYGLAKILELLDPQIFALGNLVSGHTLKHLAAALGTYWILQMLKARHPLAVPDLSTVP